MMVRKRARASSLPRPSPVNKLSKVVAQLRGEEDVYLILSASKKREAELISEGLKIAQEDPLKLGSTLGKRSPQEGIVKVVE